MLRRTHLAAVLLATAIVAIGGCASGDKTSGEGSGGGAQATVSTNTVADLGTVLVNSSGNALYVTDQESGGMVRCTADCASVWLPLTVPTGTVPTAGSGVTGSLGTVARPDGTMQVTYGGKPLYLFSLDKGPGQVGGDSLSDSFGGTAFIWHVATPGGQAPTPANPPPGPGGY